MSLTEARHSSGVPRREALNRATAALEPPFAVVDLDAFDRNAADLLRRAGGKPVRLASKSVRCRALIERALGAGLQGILAFTLPEALWLAGHGHDDLVVAYPTVDRAALRELAAGPRERVTVMVDCAEHLELACAAVREAGARAAPRLPRRRRRLVAAARAAEDRRAALPGAHARAGGGARPRGGRAAGAGARRPAELRGPHRRRSATARRGGR